MSKLEKQKSPYLARNERKLIEVCRTIGNELKVRDKAANKAISMFILFKRTNYPINQTFRTY